MCTDFLTGLNAASNTIETKYLANGAQGVIYTCETDDNSFTGSSQKPHPVPNKSGKIRYGIHRHTDSDSSSLIFTL